MKRNHFSIIMPAYNVENSIEQSICSVIEQTYSNWTLYVIDDCSSDKTSEVVNVLSSNDSRIIYVKLDINSGVAVARNTGIYIADGEYVAFLDSDDIWSGNKLEVQLAYLKSGYNLVCSNYKTFANSVSNVLSIRSFPDCFGYNDMLVGNKVGNLTGVYNQIKLGKVYQTQNGHEDYIMWLELVRRANHVYCVQEILAYYRVSEYSLSANKIRASCWQWKIYRNHLGFDYFKSTYYWLRYAFNALCR